MTNRVEHARPTSPVRLRTGLHLCSRVPKQLPTFASHRPLHQRLCLPRASRAPSVKGGHQHGPDVVPRPAREAHWASPGGGVKQRAERTSKNSPFSSPRRSLINKEQQSRFSRLLSGARTARLLEGGSVQKKRGCVLAKKNSPVPNTEPHESTSFGSSRGLRTHWPRPFP